LILTGFFVRDRLARVSLDQDTLLSLMWANNETGVRLPVEKLAQEAHEKGNRIGI
jgi:cysteine sulfinate desulfinase/cysteine desulfurase-like protein